MSRVPLRTVQDARVGARAALTVSETTNTFLPNLLRLLANAPVALETYLTVSAINARFGLNVAEREAVQITAAASALPAIRLSQPARPGLTEHR